MTNLYIVYRKDLISGEIVFSLTYNSLQEAKKTIEKMHEGMKSVPRRVRKIHNGYDSEYIYYNGEVYGKDRLAYRKIMI